MRKKCKKTNKVLWLCCLNTSATHLVIGYVTGTSLFKANESHKIRSGSHCAKAVVFVSILRKPDTEIANSVGDFSSSFFIDGHEQASVAKEQLFPLPLDPPTPQRSPLCFLCWILVSSSILIGGFWSGDILVTQNCKSEVQKILLIGGFAHWPLIWTQ